VAIDIDSRIEALSREVAALKGSSAIANPAPLGLAGFGMTTLLLNLVNAEIIKTSDIGIVLPMGLFFGGLTQLLVGMWEFKKNNTFGATAFSAYGAFWLAYAVMKIFAGNDIQAGPSADGMMWFLITWGIFTSYMFIGTLRLNVMLITVFGLLVILFFLLAWGQHSTTVHQIAGYEGLVVAAAALYGSAAQLINETWGRVVLPLGVIKK
jgi:succinate-acetate transporter protein